MNATLPIAEGDFVSIHGRHGQAIRFDAGEPVLWNPDRPDDTLFELHSESVTTYLAPDDVAYFVQKLHNTVAAAERAGYPVSVSDLDRGDTLPWRPALGSEYRLLVFGLAVVLWPEAANAARRDLIVWVLCGTEPDLSADLAPST